MNVAFVTNVVYPFVPGGAQKRIHEIGRRLARKGHEISIYGRHYWDGSKETTHEGMTLRAAAPAADLYKKEGRRSITEALDFAARALPTLRRHVDEHDLVVVSVFPYFPVLTSRLCTSLSDTPLVTTWHEVWGEYWDEYLDKLGIGGKIVERLTATLPQHATAVSGVTADRLAQLGMDRRDIDVVPNGIDFDQVQSAPMPDDTHPRDGALGFDILFAGRLIDEKNVDILLDAFDRVAETHDVTLGIIGDGPKADKLQTHAAGLTHSERVTFLGYVAEDDAVLGHMKAADIFASPSTREGFGITFAEAMAADCTVVAADHPKSAASEVLGDAGFVVEPTVDSVAASLARTLEGDRPAEPPQERALQYDWSNIAPRAERVYQSAIGQPVARSERVYDGQNVSQQ